MSDWGARHQRPTRLARFRIETEGGGRYRLQGELTFASAGEALKATAGLVRPDADLLFDLRSIGRCDSAGVALLIEWRRRVQPGGRIRYLHLPASLRAIARVSGVEALLSNPVTADPAAGG